MSSSSCPSRSSSASSKNGSTHTPVPQSTKDSSSPNSEGKITATPKQSSTSNSGGKSMTMTSSFQTPKKTAASLPPLVSSSMTPLYEDETRQYYKSIELMMTPPAAKWDAFGNNNNNNDGIGSSCSDLKQKKGSSKWTVRVGDLACLQIEPPNNDHHCSNHNDDTPKTTTTAYYYQPIQILSIYQERQKNKLSTSDRKKRKRYTKDVFVEVRYFYRRGDLDERNQRYYYHSNDGEKVEEEEVEEEVLESDRVEVVHASFLLGRLVLNNNTSHCSNNNRLSSSAAAAKATADDDDDDGENASVPTVTMNYNHRLYLHQEKDVLQFNPLEDDTTTTATTKTTTDALLIRGIQSSHIMEKDDKVKLATCNYLNLNMFGNNIIEEEGNDDVEQVVTLPPPTLTLQQPKVDMSSSSSPTTKKVSPNKRSPKQHRPPPSLNNHENSSSITTTTHYYPSCQIQFPASPTIHPYESPPITWNVCVGDVVAVHCMDGISPIGVDKRGNNDDDGSSSTTTTTEWYPYREPWAHAQITAIYRHVVVDETTATTTTSNNSGDDSGDTSITTTTTVSARKVQYDLRWFPRISESLDICQDKPVLSKRLLEIASDTSRTCEEILEGNHEEVGFTFLTLLGPILIDDDGTKNTAAAAAAAAGSKTQFATQNRRTINSTIYCDKLSQPKQLSPQKRVIATSGSSTIDGLVDRGIEASRLWMSRHSQRKVYREAVLQSRKARDDGIVTMDDDHMSESASIPPQKSPDSWSQKQTLFNESPAVAAAAAAPTTTPKERRGKRGKAPVVAKAESEPKAKKRKQTNHDGVAADDNHVTVSASISSQKSPAEPAQKQTLFNQRPTTPAAAPATTTTTKERRSKRGKAPVANAEQEPAPEPKKHKKQLTTSRKKELTSPQIEDTEDDVVPPRVIKCTKQPFHVDVSSQKSFYDEIEIQPPFDSYDDRFSSANKHDNNKQLLWKVRLGDMVCINVEEQHQKADLVTFPFAVTWSPAEIVSIYRVHSNKAECLELREKLQSGDQHLNDVDDDTFDVMVEVRWFYRKHEIPGAGSKSSKSQSDIGDELEEIFETDQINTCAAECLLSPVKLYEVSRPEESLPSVVSGMPCIHYHCRRYWSIHRKSFVPSGLLSNRVERGRMHSEYKAALSKLPSTSARNGKKASEGYSWKEGFQSAIQKLSLAEAAADVQVHGMELRCRERERQHIGSFLRKAIRGLEQRTNNSQDDDSVMRDDEGPMNTKSSIFICGPPGTGKTASVRSIINELQEEQASGNLPEFNFIALNGMEMRSPFDSYVKFWEALSGTRKERLSAGAAAAKLEEYFGDGERDESNEERSKKPITVLMLDEIDYLVTKKQTILYNFFDWPLRATNARLIVIGISNTINLPERLSLKLQSRLGGERCHFKSYTVDETVAILKTRLDGDASEVFDEDAIKFASRKTGNLSGDIRKAFHMCKVAAQNAFDDYASGRRRIVEGSHPKVKISDVQRGSRDMYTSIIHKAISCSSSYEALVLIAIGALKKAKVGKDIVSLDVQEMLTKIESIANGSGEERYLSARLSLGDLLGILSRLGDAGILTLTTPKHSNHPWPLIQTSLEPYEINSSYRNTSHSKLAEKHLAEQRLF